MGFIFSLSLKVSAGSKMAAGWTLDPLLIVCLLVSLLESTARVVFPSLKLTPHTLILVSGSASGGTQLRQPPSEDLLALGSRVGFVRW